MDNEWHVNPHTDRIEYLGGWRTRPGYRGCISQGEDGRWAVQPLDYWTQQEHTVLECDTREEARTALKNVTPDGHKCEVFVADWLGHCPDRASVISPTVFEPDERGILLCPTHSRTILRDNPRVPVAEWEAKNGPITHEGGPIVGERIGRKPARIRRSEYLSKPVVWGDDWSGYTPGMQLAEDVTPGALFAFRPTGNAFEVKSIDRVDMPDGREMLRFNCNDGATAGAYEGEAVVILHPPF
ncbi:hypothetical protein ACIRLA_28735 [Streptomyces sp. NPDC102364]|uniref:hypothetical protein n=1 Tax=Streptomyces sp. NPDC102364 TaxID=3366161 RepID=UPI0037FF50E0